MRTVARLPAVVLVLVLAALPLQAWLAVGRADVRIGNPLDDLRSVVWAGTLRADGDLAVAVTYRFGDAGERTVDVRLPDGARLLRVNGAPVAADVGKYATVPLTGRALHVEYEVSGRVERHDDGVLVDFAGLAELNGKDRAFPPDDFDPTAGDAAHALFECPRCYLDVEGYGDTVLYGALFARDVAGARVAVGGVDQLRVAEEPGAIRFVGELSGGDRASLVAVLPLGAAPDAPTAADEAAAVTDGRPVDAGEPAGGAATAGDAYDDLRDRAAAADLDLREESSGAPISKVAVAVLLTAMWLAVVTWIVARLVAARRSVAADAHPAVPPSASFDPPNELEPALVAAVVGGAGAGERSLSAATLLALAHRGVIRIDGIDAERYTLTIPAGAHGATATEEILLDALRPQGKATSTATLTGPPLWGPDASKVEGRVLRAVMKDAQKAGLLRVTLATWILVPASVLMGLVALIETEGESVLAWIITFAGPVVAFVAGALAGVHLTRRGRAERDRWVAYGEWLRTNTRLAEVGAPGIVTWGEPLVYATVLGAAPKAATALGVRG